MAGLLFACMGESDPKTVYQRIGVVQQEPEATFHTIDGYRITSPAFDGVPAGNCYRVDFKTYTLPDFPQGNVYDAEVTRMDTIPVWPFAGAFTDTSRIFPDEERLKTIRINKQNNYLDGRLFVYVTRDSFFRDETARYDLSYNWEETKNRDANGNYIYDLFLRFNREGGTDTVRVANTLFSNAFVLDEFLRKASEKEISAGKDSVIMRVNYAQTYNRDSSAWTWSVTDTFALHISTPR